MKLPKRNPPLEIEADAITVTELIAFLRTAHPNAVVVRGTKRRYRNIRRVALDDEGSPIPMSRPIVIIE